MKRLLKSSTSRVRKWLIRDRHQPGRVYAHVESVQQPVLERNQKIRGAGLLKRGGALKAVDEGADLGIAFQFPGVIEYHAARQKYPDIFAQLEQGGDDAVRAGERLALLMPQYVTSVGNRGRIVV